jgi:hypothetical protein
MNKIYSRNIGIFGNKQQVYNKMKKISETLPKEDIIRTILSIEPSNCIIEMKNGDRYMGVPLTEISHGCRLKQMYIPYDADLEILYSAFLPMLISDLPEHEQIIGYWF